jgi:adenine deaminase
MASTVAHDSHNIVAVGTSAENLEWAINLAISNKGALCCVAEGLESVLPLPVAGLMSDRNWKWVARRYEDISNMARALGARPHSPFMLLSFMALPVIPKLKLTDRGLFDTTRFGFTDLWAE